MASFACVASGIARLLPRKRARARARNGAHRRVTTRSWANRDAGTAGPPRMMCGSNPEDDEDRAKDDAPDADSRCLGRRRLALGALGASLGSRALSPQIEPARALVDEANATRVFDAASRSVVSLAVYDPNGTSGGYTPRGTGVVWAAFAEGGFVVTSFHVVKDFVPGAPSGAGKKDRSRDETRIASRVLRVQVPEEVSGFSEALESHRDRIRKRINELNEHLSRVTFDRKEQTFIQLKFEDAGDDGVRRFKKLRRHALEGDLEADDEDERRRERYHRVEQFLGELEQDEKWTERVIDVRNWFRFRADEFYKEEETLRQSYSGAAGKSGGEKNRLASTILATAIAYQYGIDVGGKQTETFRLVAVDEMFSKTDDEFSQFLLDLFKEFHLQLLIVQPLDAKIHVVQKYVERYHVVERRDGVSFVGDLSVREYIGGQLPGEDAVEELEDDKVESES